MKRTGGVCYRYPEVMGRRFVTAVCCVGGLGLPACAHLSEPEPAVVVVDEPTEREPFHCLPRFEPTQRLLETSEGSARYSIGKQTNEAQTYRRLALFEFRVAGHGPNPSYRVTLHELRKWSWTPPDRRAPSPRGSWEQAIDYGWVVPQKEFSLEPRTEGWCLIEAGGCRTEANTRAFAQALGAVLTAFSQSPEVENHLDGRAPRSVPLITLPGAWLRPYTISTAAVVATRVSDGWPARYQARFDNPRPQVDTDGVLQWTPLDDGATSRLVYSLGRSCHLESVEFTRQSRVGNPGVPGQNRAGAPALPGTQSVYLASSVTKRWQRLEADARVDTPSLPVYDPSAKREVDVVRVRERLPKQLRVPPAPSE